MKTYPQDLREKVAAVAQDKQSNRQVAELMSISEPTIEKWMRRAHSTTWSPPWLTSCALCAKKMLRPDSPIVVMP